MKRTFFFILIASSICTRAQKGIEGLIQAEKNFAAYSVAHGTNQAFLHFMDSAAIVFENGKPVNAMKAWEKKEQQKGILNWYPLTAGISSGGDFGYTSGPWYYRPSANDTIVASGQFTSIWHLDQHGQWKFLLDMGTNKVPLPVQTDTILWKKPAPVFKKGNESSLLSTDSVFTASLRKHASAAYHKYMSSVCLLNRSGGPPQEGRWKNFPENLYYKVLGYGTSPAGDLGYVYGIATLDNQSDNYLRIWRREGAKWKLALEVLRIGPKTPISP